MGKMRKDLGPGLPLGSICPLLIQGFHILICVHALPVAVVVVEGELAVCCHAAESVFDHFTGFEVWKNSCLFKHHESAVRVFLHDWILFEFLDYSFFVRFDESVLGTWMNAGDGSNSAVCGLLCVVEGKERGDVEISDSVAIRHHEAIARNVLHHLE